MSLKPDDVFQIGTITRAGIARDLNEQLGRTEFADDDDRLTDGRCKHYCSEIKWDPDMAHQIAEDVAESILRGEK